VKTQTSDVMTSVRAATWRRARQRPIT
jgi:hypothetical protein